MLVTRSRVKAQVSDPGLLFFPATTVAGSRRVPAW